MRGYHTCERTNKKTTATGQYQSIKFGQLGLAISSRRHAHQLLMFVAVGRPPFCDRSKPEVRRYRPRISISDRASRRRTGPLPIHGPTSRVSRPAEISTFLVPDASRAAQGPAVLQFRRIRLGCDREPTSTPYEMVRIEATRKCRPGSPPVWRAFQILNPKYAEIVD